MRDIAEAVGISRQAVYLHFGSRTELSGGEIGRDFFSI
jgi:AcrR family transcriptional regulator